MEFKTYHNSEGTEVEAAVVDNDTAGTKVQLVGGRPYETKAGDVVVRTQNANFVDVVPGRDFDKDYNAGEFNARRSSTQDSETGESTDGLFDPNARSAADVREYLSRTDIDETERARVRQAEEEGRNRKTAYPE